ncbi:uncharacterized protein BP5553_04847 [Venustampulla echinocandica]|uniref:Uncharacterized protein n=1 Tax=Venustampulla echinocandica TaxID=2656787 RepID=A0A370TPG6_9HELO|nr:uncharacterized protein BP5553_04847 [Venustampulla echinocandica]RDL37414.1 hypothetical protein BP5553_04847 [Venustampulla echinocandica]
MQNQANICVVCRHALAWSNRPRTRTGLRWASTKPPHIYNLPRVVVDLDAFDSKIVRKLEDIPEKEQAISWRPSRIPVRLQECQNPKTQTAQASSRTNAAKMRGLRWHRWAGNGSLTRQDVGNPEQSNGNCREMEINMPSPRSNFKPMTATAPDLLMYALLGEPTASHNPKNTFLRQLLRSNGLLAAESTEENLEQLTLQFPTDPLANAIQAGFTPESEALLKQEIFTGLWSFSEICRFISMLSSTSQGCQFIAKFGDDIVKLLRRCRFISHSAGAIDGQQITTSMILKLLNSLVLNIDSKGLKPGAGLCHAGLYYASRSGNLSAVRMYLEMSRKNGYSIDWKVVRAFKALLVTVAKELELSNPWPPWKDNDSRRLEIMNFITEWRGKTRPRPSKKGAIWSPSFGMPITTTSSVQRSYLYATYVFGLGEMGSKTALRAEWEAVKAMLPDSDYLQHAQVFAIAFILARDPDQALKLLKDVPEGGMMDTPDPLQQAMLQNLFSYHYSFHDLKESSGVTQLVTRGVWELWHSRRRPEHALKVLEGLLVIDFPKFLPNTARKIHWASVDGKEGLRVLSERPKSQLYFKSAGEGFPLKMEDENECINT